MMKYEGTLNDQNSSSVGGKRLRGICESKNTPCDVRSLKSPNILQAKLMNELV